MSCFRLFFFRAVASRVQRELCNSAASGAKGRPLPAAFVEKIAALHNPPLLAAAVSPHNRKELREFLSLNSFRTGIVLKNAEHLRKLLNFLRHIIAAENAEAHAFALCFLRRLTGNGPVGVAVAGCGNDFALERRAAFGAIFLL